MGGGGVSRWNRRTTCVRRWGMSSYSVPGEFFENMSVPQDDESYDDVDYDAYDADLYSDRQDRVELDPISAAVKELRSLASRLKAERHPLAHIPQQVANRLVDVRAPAPRLPEGLKESPTGNCTACGRALPMPTMGRGRPRTKCTICSPPKARPEYSAKKQ